MATTSSWVSSDRNDCKARSLARKDVTSIARSIYEAIRRKIADVIGWMVGGLVDSQPGRDTSPKET